MLIANFQTADSIEVDIFNAMIGFEEDKALTKKQLRSKRMCAARKAIEQRRENKSLSNSINEVWFLDS